eukprot:RCo043835
MGNAPGALTESDVAFLQRDNSLSAEEIVLLHTIFRSIAEETKENRLTLEKILEGCVKARMNEDQIDTLRSLFSCSHPQAMDRDQSGSVEFQEYVLAVAVMTNQAGVEKKIELAFAMLDKDGDKRIAKDEMALGLKRLNRVIEMAEFSHTWGGSDEEVGVEPFAILSEADFDAQIDSWISKLFTEFDLDKTETLTQEEFVKVVERHPFILDLNSRLVAEGPGSFLLGRRSSSSKS